MREIIKKIRFNKEKMIEAVDKSYATATDLSDWLVQELGYTFREAYTKSAKIVEYAIKKNKSLANLSIKELKKFDININMKIFNVLSPLNSIKNKKSVGATAPDIVKHAIKVAEKKYL